MIGKNMREDAEVIKKSDKVVYDWSGLQSSLQ